MKNIVIEVLNPEHGKKVIEYFKSLGVNTGDFTGLSTKKVSPYHYYGVIHGRFSNYCLSDVKIYGAKVITLPEENTYPKVMYVSNRPISLKNTSDLKKRVVFMEKNDKYLAWINAETLEGAEKINSTSAWNYALDIPKEPVVKEITIEEIAKLLNMDPTKIRIKK